MGPPHSGLSKARSLRLLALHLAVAAAGVQRGSCYCNVGVCYKTVAGAHVICKTDDDFFGGGKKEKTQAMARRMLGGAKKRAEMDRGHHEEV